MSRTSFISGALVGVVAGLLLAPQKGEELREEIADNAKKWKRKLYKMAGKSTSQLSDLQEILEGEIDGLSENMRHRLRTVLNESQVMV